jgi:HTH-type transcriptional regulator/antitoxin HigA
MIANTSLKTSGVAKTRRFDPKKYSRLVAAGAPAAIRSEAEYDRAIAQIEALLRKGDRISAEEERLLDLFSTLVECYEEEHYDFEASSPHEILQHLMEARDLKQKDIMHLFGSSGRASEAINGVRPISRKQAKTLAEFFHVSADLFL